MMLLFRSIILLIVGLVASQEYDEHYEESPSHPDYSKYFNVDTSAPLVSLDKTDASSPSGFTSPIDFSSFFGPQHFDIGSASNAQAIKVDNTEPDKAGFVNTNDFKSGFGDIKDPFDKDYFEQAQRADKESDDEAESKPGPNYISYRVPAKTKTNREDAVDDKDEFSYEYAAENSENVPKKKINYSYNVEHKPQVKDRSEEVASLEATSAPYTPEYYSKFAQTPQPLTPYQQYSFQPIPDNYGLKTSFVSNIQSTATPFNPTYEKVVSTPYVSQQTENIPKSLKLKANACQKVNKQVSEKDIKTGRFKRQAMDCFVCEDPKTGANYEQCSYSSEPKTENYFVGTAEKFSQPVSPLTHRFRREAKKKQKESAEEDYVNPYDYVKSQSHKYYSKPEDFESTQYNPKDFGNAEEYRFGPEFFSDGEEAEQQEKSYSEKQSEALKSNPENCKKVKKSGMTCMICKNEKTGGNYEQCSYTSAPAEKKYAYVRERKFDKDDNPIEDKVTESSDPEEIAEGSEAEEKHVPKRRFRPTKAPQKLEQKTDNRRLRSRYNSPKSEETTKSEDGSYEVPVHFEKSTTELKPLRGLDPKLYGSADLGESSEKETKKSASYEIPELQEYHFKLFPQHNKEESKTEEKRVKVPDRYKSFEAEETKKDVEEVLAEFAKKDRSNCKKAQRHGMTCYLCVNKKGLEHEECMYVSESKPKSSHVAYHEMQKVKSPKAEKDGTHSESKIKETEQAPIKRKRVIYKKPTTTETPKEIATDSYRSSSRNEATTSTIVPKRVTRRLRRTKNVANDSKKSSEEDDKAKVVKRKVEEAEPTLKTPKEFQVGSEEGAYSTDTKPVYSKQFGGPLPKYMVEKSEYELDFEKSLAH